MFCNHSALRYYFQCTLICTIPHAVMILIWESPKGQKLNCTDNHLWPSLQACLRYRYHLHTRFLPSSFMYPGVGGHPVSYFRGSLCRRHFASTLAKSRNNRCSGRLSPSFLTLAAKTRVLSSSLVKAKTEVQFF